MKPRPITGRKFVVRDLNPEDEGRMTRFFAGLQKCDQSKVAALLCFAADEGPPNNETKHKPLRDGVAEFKVGRIRIMFFIVGNEIILTHGFFKGPKKSQTNEIDKAVAYRKEYLKIK